MVMSRKKIRSLNVPEPRCTFSKIEIASSNLDSAIRLWFEDNPLPSVLVLAYAAYDIIHVLCEAETGTEHGYFFMNNFIEKEKREELELIFRYPYNSIHHAGKEQRTLTVHKYLPVIVIFYAIVEMTQISELSFYQKLFISYIGLKHPDWYSEDETSEASDNEQLYNDNQQYYFSVLNDPSLRSSVANLDVSKLFINFFSFDET